MNRRRFLLALAALPVVGRSVKAVPREVAVERDIDYKVTGRYHDELSSHVETCVPTHGGGGVDMRVTYWRVDGDGSRVQIPRPAGYPRIR